MRYESGHCCQHAHSPLETLPVVTSRVMLPLRSAMLSLSVLRWAHISVLTFFGSSPTATEPSASG